MKTQKTKSQPAYTPCAAKDIPAGVRFDVAARNQGQIVEVAYGGFFRAEHDEGDEFKRVIDHSEGVASAKYFRLDRGAVRS